MTEVVKEHTIDLTIDFFKREKVVPVAVIENANDAVDIANALVDGGIHSIEVTLRTDSAKKAIKNIADNCPKMVVGAGTVLNRQQAEEAVAAGAKFLVSPALIPEVIDYGKEKNIPVMPGCATPTEFATARKMGLSYVKFFPAENYGGVKTIKSLASVFPDISIMPTGGINIRNIKEYLDCSNV